MAVYQVGFQEGQEAVLMLFDLREPALRTCSWKCESVSLHFDFVGAVCCGGGSSVIQEIVGSHSCM